MTRAYRSILVAATLAAAFMLPTLASDLNSYTNARFGVTGLVPSGFLPQPKPVNGDGRRFMVADGLAEVSIYGSYDAMGDVPEYRAFLKETYSETGQVTYQAGGADWFVLSGLSEGRLFYLRVVQGHNCHAEIVYAHMYVAYAQRARDRMDPLIGPMGKGLGFAPC